MRPRNLLFVVASLAIPNLLGPISVGTHAQTSPPATQIVPQASEKPYDWTASFAKYPTGKVPRTGDGKPDLQGIWSRSVLTPLQRRGDKTEISEAEAREAEDAAQQAAINLRVEPPGTPPGEKTTDAYN